LTCPAKFSKSLMVFTSTAIIAAVRWKFTGRKLPSPPFQVALGSALASAVVQ
jgi:hypothetical protein